MMVGAMNTAITSTFPLPAINHGTFTGTLIVSYSNPLPTSQATVLATLDIFYLDFEPVDFYLGPSMPSDSSQGLPMVILDDYSFMDVHPSTVSTPAAEINDPACSVVEDRGTSFGLVKALFAR
jgi:hypothetical protein